MSAWDKFFCASCQEERPVSERVRVAGNRARCLRCKTLKSPRKYESSAGHYEDEYERPAIPTGVLDAYRESID